MAKEMSRSEQLTFFKAIISHDLNSNLQAFALHTVALEAIRVANSIAIEPGEEWFIESQKAVIASLRAASGNEINVATNSERANKTRKTAEKGAKAIHDYAVALAAVTQPVQAMVDALEKLLGNDVY